MGTLEGTSKVVCTAPVTKDTAGVQEVKASYTLAGMTVSDVTTEQKNGMVASFAKKTGVDPTQVTEMLQEGSPWEKISTRLVKHF